MPADLLTQISDFEKRVARFGGSISASYEAVEEVTGEEATDIELRYLPAIIHLSSLEKTVILNSLVESWIDVESKAPFSEGQRRHWMKWGKASLGVAKYLLRPTGIDSVERDLACDVVVRISRWFYTTTGFWKIGREPARVIVATAWSGDIDNFRGSS